HRHQHGPEPLWSESWYFDFANADGTLGGYVRLGLLPNERRAWYWAYLVGEGRPLVAVRDHEAPLPTGGALEVRAEGLWAELVCETPDDHWSINLEAFGVALDDPAEASRGRRGDGTAFHAATTLLEGVDWHPGFVVAPGTTETATIDGFTVATDTGDEGLPVVARMRLHDLDLTVVPLAHAPVLLEAADGRVSRFPRSLCRFDTTDGRRGYGWTEWNQLG